MTLRPTLFLVRQEMKASSKALLSTSVIEVLVAVGDRERLARHDRGEHGQRHEQRPERDEARGQRQTVPLHPGPAHAATSGPGPKCAAASAMMRDRGARSARSACSVVPSVRRRTMAA